MVDATVAAVQAQLAQLENPKIRAVNAKHGDGHGVNLTALRGLAKALKHQPALARELWATDDAGSKLVAILVAKPKDFSADDYDRMLRTARWPKVHDWLVGYLVGKSPHTEALRLRWLDDADPVVASAGWALTADRVVKKPEGLDHEALLDTIEAEMPAAPDRLQWQMNTTLAMIGIERDDLRDRALELGERLGVLRDYPTPPNCTSPFAPTWINEMVRRKNS